MPGSVSMMSLWRRICWPSCPIGRGVNSKKDDESRQGQSESESSWVALPSRKKSRWRGIAPTLLSGFIEDEQQTRRRRCGGCQS
jgi:hypothetical protein